MKERKIPQIPLPSWVFLALLGLALELALHLWTAAEIVPGRVAAVAMFGLGFGALLGGAFQMLPDRLCKSLTVTAALFLGLMCLLEYFLDDAYGYFMNLKAAMDGAGGIATDFLSVVLALLGKNLLRIGLILLPALLYGVFAKAEIPFRWVHMLCGLLVGIVLVGGGLGVVYSVDLDSDKLEPGASYDGALRGLGLHMSLVLDASGNFSGSKELDFEIPQATQAPTEITEPPETEPAPTEPVVTEPPVTEPPVVLMPHAYELDYAALAAAEPNQNIARLHSYVASLTPAMENLYTGLFAGKNLIFITAEAFTTEAIDPELSPTLYRLANEGIQFTNYYQPTWGSGTTGGEFSNVAGLQPYGGVKSMMEAVEQNLFLTMGNQLQRQGYASGAFHNHDYTYYSRQKTHTELGYDKFFAWGNGMEKLISDGWTRSDLEMMQVTLPEYLEQDKPFSLYYMSLSGHSDYAVHNTMARKNLHLVEHLPYSLAVRCYLACNLELEAALAYTVEALEKAGIADDTVIVISADHYPYGLDPSDTWGNDKNYLAELYGVRYVTEERRDRNTLIIWSGCVESMDIVVDTPVYSLDILPTLSNLFGLEYDSRLLPGRDVFSEEEPLVYWPNGSWKTDKGYYNANNGTFTPNEGLEVEEGYVERIKALVSNKQTFSRGVQNYNYYDVISKLLGIER